MGIPGGDFVRIYDEQRDVAFWERTLPDGRRIQVFKTSGNVFRATQRATTVRHTVGWRWLVANPTTSQVCEAQVLMRRRADAIASALEWVAENPVDKIQPEHAVA